MRVSARKVPFGLKTESGNSPLDAWVQNLKSHLLKSSRTTLQCVEENLLSYFRYCLIVICLFFVTGI